MATTVHMPQWGMTMTEGKIVKWLKNVGDPVEKGELLFEAETEKIVNQVEALATGMLFQIIVQEGETAAVGAIVALIALEGETPELIDNGNPEANQSENTDANPQGTGTRPPNTTGRSFIKASPAAKRRARELGIDLSTVSGTGPGGRITEKDVVSSNSPSADSPRATPLAKNIAEKADLDLSTVTGTGTRGKITKSDVESTLAAASPATEASRLSILPYTGMRKGIGDNMRASLEKAAQLTVFTEVDVTEMVRFRDTLREAFSVDHGTKVSYNDIILLAVSRALKKHPIMNSTHEGEEIRLHDQANLGMAVSIKDGLIVPVLKNVNRKGLKQIATETRQLAEKARTGALTPDDVSGGTFTVSNTSMIAVDGFTPILRPPETGILGVGRVNKKPAEYEGEIVLRWMMWLSLTYNHCVVDGAPAHSFLATVGSYLSNPYLIMA